LKLSNILKNGIFKDNPVLVQLVGLCSVLAVTTTIVNAFSMGMAVTFVLVCANLVVSLLRNVIPEKIRIPSFIVVIATFVTIVEMFMEAFAPAIYDSLGIFLPLIVVNCIILARAESFAYKNKILPSVVDGLGNGLGYTLSVVILAAIRELFGAGTLLADTALQINVFGNAEPAAIFVEPAGAFIVLGIMIAVFNSISKKRSEKKAVTN